MSITAEGLRLAYPIIDEENYPDSRVEWWLAEVQAMPDLRPSLWGGFLERGVYAYAAHELILEREQELANTDGLGGMNASTGTLASVSDSVEGVSHSESYQVSSSSQSTQFEGDDLFRLTYPGRKFLRLRKIVGLTRGAAYVE